MSIVDKTDARIAEYESDHGVVHCKVCDKAVIADGTYNRFSREIVDHALTHNKQPIDAAGVLAYGKFLAETRDESDIPLS